MWGTGTGLQPCTEEREKGTFVLRQLANKSVQSKIPRWCTSQNRFVPLLAPQEPLGSKVIVFNNLPAGTQRASLLAKEMTRLRKGENKYPLYFD